MRTNPHSKYAHYKHSELTSATRFYMSALERDPDNATYKKARDDALNVHLLTEQTRLLADLKTRYESDLIS